jgi:predicted protein tyrosine phosphatase
MPWIGNYSYEAIRKGLHAFEPGRTILIRIMDIGREMYQWEPARWKDFVAIHYFNFQDIDDPDYGAMQDEEAAQMASILKDAYEKNLNVVVHCVAGVCRSGAVTEVGVIMGFQDCETHRIPNLRVKKATLDALGLTNSWDDEAEKKRAQELTSQHYFMSTGDILVPREHDE